MTCKISSAPPRERTQVPPKNSMCNKNDEWMHLLDLNAPLLYRPRNAVFLKTNEEFLDHVWKHVDFEQRDGTRLINYFPVTCTASVAAMIHNAYNDVSRLQMYSDGTFGVYFHVMLDRGDDGSEIERWNSLNS